MNNRLRVLAALAGAVIAVFTWPQAQASEYGCQVLLCLSNPQGPTAVAQCHPPIQRFLREQAESPPKGMPSCEETNGQAILQSGISAYDPCPSGTRALEAGQRAVLQPRKNTRVFNASEVPVFTGIGEGDGSASAGTAKVCVGEPRGSITLVTKSGSGDAEFSVSKFVEAFEALVTLDADSESR